MNIIDRNRYIWVAVSALIQGLILGVYALILSGPLTCMPLTVIFIVPFVFWLSQEYWGKRLWNLLLGLTAVLLVFWVYRLWSLYSPEGSFYVVPSQKSDLIRISMAVFLLIPFFQCRIASWSWKVPYSDIFFQFCRNLFLLFQASIVIVVFWGLLITAGLLFDIVGLDSVPLLIFNPLTAVPLSAIIIAISISVAIRHPGIDSLGRWLLSVLAWLLPFFSVLSVMFLLCLPFVGLHTLFSTGQASTLMLLLQFGTLILANAAYLDGVKSSFRTKWIDNLAKVSLLCLPFYAVLCIYSLSLRISQYGLTTDRIQALFLALTVGLWGLGYAITVLLGKWPHYIGRVNISAIIFMAATVTLMNSPILDPSRLAASNQKSRILAGLSDPDYLYMRFRLGRWGINVLHELGDAGSKSALDADPQEYSRYLKTGVPPENVRREIIAGARVFGEQALTPEMAGFFCDNWKLNGIMSSRDIAFVLNGGYIAVFTADNAMVYASDGLTLTGSISGDFDLSHLDDAKIVPSKVPDVVIGSRTYRLSLDGIVEHVGE